jgi:hypothetical protein
MKIGYGRASTLEQNLDSAFGQPPEEIPTNSAMAIHPKTVFVSNWFVALWTQIIGNSPSSWTSANAINPSKDVPKLVFYSVVP